MNANIRICYMLYKYIWQTNRIATELLYSIFFISKFCRNAKIIEITINIKDKNSFKAQFSFVF